MDKKEALRAVTMLLIKKRQSFKQHLKMLILKWQKNVQIINAIAGLQGNGMQQIAALLESTKMTEICIPQTNRQSTFGRFYVSKMDSKIRKTMGLTCRWKKSKRKHRNSSAI